MLWPKDFTQNPFGNIGPDKSKNGPKYNYSQVRKRNSSLRPFLIPSCIWYKVKHQYTHNIVKLFTWGCIGISQ